MSNSHSNGANGDPGQNLSAEHVRTLRPMDVAVEVERGRFGEPFPGQLAVMREVDVIERCCRGDLGGIDPRTSGEISGRDTGHIGDIDYLLEQTPHGLRVRCEASRLYPQADYTFDEHGRLLQVVETLPAGMMTLDANGDLRRVNMQSREWVIGADGRVQRQINRAYLDDGRGRWKWDVVEDWTPDTWARAHPASPVLPKNERDQLRLLNHLQGALWQPWFDRPASAYRLQWLKDLCDGMMALRGETGDDAYYRAEWDSDGSGGLSVIHTSEHDTWSYHFTPAIDGTIGRLTELMVVHDPPILAPESISAPTLVGPHGKIDGSVTQYTYDADGNLLVSEELVHDDGSGNAPFRPTKTVTRADWLAEQGRY